MRQLTFIACLVALTASSADMPDSRQLQPFRATYSLTWRNFDAGTSELKLERESDQQYVYSSRSNASGVFRAFFSNEISQTSWLKVT